MRNGWIAAVEIYPILQSILKYAIGHSKLKGSKLIKG
jgi:hypothetical protein